MAKLILAILATYRLSQLIAWDNGPYYIFENLRTKIKDKSDEDWQQKEEIAKINSTNPKRGFWQTLDDGIVCPYCLGVYFALICVILFIRPKRKELLSYWLGVAGGQAFLQGLTKDR